MKFCIYMLANGACRLSHLRVLDISVVSRAFRKGGEEARDCARLLASLLEQAHNLRHLALAAVEALLECEPRIGIAIAAHPDFSQLAFHDLGQRSMEVLRNLRSQPRKVEVYIETSFSDLYAIFSSISSLQQTDTLTLSWHFRSPVMVAILDDLAYTWPAVRQLEVDTSDVELSTIVRAFPNVRVFNMEDMMDTAGNPLRSFWPSLDYLRVYPAVLTELSIACPVYFLCLPTMLGPRAWQGESYTPKALLTIRNVSPAVLAIEIAVSELPDTFWTELVHNAPRLHSIYVRLFAGSRDRGLESVMAAWMDTVPAILAALSGLVHLELCISSNSQINTSRNTLEEYSNTLVKRIPSLRQLAVGYGHSGDPRSPDEPPFVGTFWWWKAIDVEEKGRWRP